MEKAGQPLTPEEVARIAHISQRLADNPRAFLGNLDHVTARADSKSAPFHKVPSQTSAPTISSEIIASIAATVTATMKEAMPLMAPNPVPSLASPSTPKLPNRPEKPPDIPEYNTTETLNN